MNAQIKVVSLLHDHLVHRVLAFIGIAALDIWGVINFPAGVFSVSALYLGAALLSIVALTGRFDLLVALYFGLFSAAVATGRLSPATPILNFANIIGVMPIFFLSSWFTQGSYKYGYPYIRVAIFWILSGPVQAAVSAAWFFSGMKIFFQMPSTELLAGAWSWIIGDILIATLITTPAIAYLIAKSKQNNSRSS